MSSPLPDLEDLFRLFEEKNQEEDPISDDPFPPPHIPVLPAVDSSHLPLLGKRSCSSNDAVETEESSRSRRKKESSRRGTTNSNPNAGTSVVRDDQEDPRLIEEDAEQRRLEREKKNEQNKKCNAKRNRLWKALLSILPGPKDKREVKNEDERELYAARLLKEVQCMIASKERELAWTSRQAVAEWMKKELSPSSSFDTSLQIIVEFLAEQTKAESASVWQPVGLTPDLKLDRSLTEIFSWSRGEGWRLPLRTIDNRVSRIPLHGARVLRRQDHHEVFKAFSSLRPSLSPGDDSPQLISNKYIKSLLTIPIIALEHAYYVIVLHLNLSDMETVDQQKLIDYARMISVGFWNVTQVRKFFEGREK